MRVLMCLRVRWGCSMNRRLFLLENVTLGLAATLPIGVLASMPAGAEVGRAAPAFALQDAGGQARKLSDFTGKTVVLEWSSSSCPFAAAQYTSGRMQDLQQWAASRGIVWLTVLSSHPSRSDYLPAAQAEAFNRKRGGGPSALLIDGSGAMGRAYGAATANHMFVIAANGMVAYAGGIDDSKSMKAKEVAASRNHVRAALEDMLAGRPVATPATEPFGCALAYGS